MNVNESTVNVFVNVNQAIQNLEPGERAAALEVVRATVDRVVQDEPTAGVRTAVIMLPNGDAIPGVQGVPSFKKLAYQIVASVGDVERHREPVGC